MFKNLQFQKILANLNALDMRQRLGLGLLGLTLTVGMLAFSYMLNTPSTAPVYTEISREELSRMSRILSENGITFDIDLNGGSISVTPGNIDTARLLFAEHGLPSGSSTGYELFDKVNSLGLTSFMQEVTKTRATEGELSRTIQMIEGIRAARVHLVLPHERGFRARSSEGPTASVVISANGSVSPATATSIRHLVAGGVRGLSADNVTVLRADGTLISSSDDKVAAGSLRLAELESKYEREIADKINAALGSHLGEENYRVSVTAKLNSDQRRTDETIFFPESRVERSVRVVRENGSTENSASSTPTTVAENLPEETQAPPLGQSTTENNEKRDEVTNYEISQKKISTISDGYEVRKLAVALVVNRARIAELLPADADQAAFEAKLSELQQAVQAAIGYSGDRGDLVEVSAFEFLPQDSIEAGAGTGAAKQFLARNFSAIINAVAAVVGALILALLVVRPVLAYLSRERPQSPAQAAAHLNQLMAGGAPGQAASDGPRAEAQAVGIGALGAPGGERNATGVPQLAAEGAGPVGQQDRLAHHLAGLINQSEERAAFVLRDWLASGAGAER